MTPEQFERLLAVLQEPDKWGIFVNFLAIVASVAIAVCSARDSEKRSRRQTIFERRFEVYSELSGYLQQVTADHDQAAKLRSKIYGLITKTYFFASESINDLLQDFLGGDTYIKEVEHVQREGRKRDKTFNEFDAQVWTIIECMKHEANYRRDITPAEIAEKQAEQRRRIGNPKSINLLQKAVKGGYYESCSAELYCKKCGCCLEHC